MLFLLHDLPTEPPRSLFIENVSIVSHCLNIFNNNSSGSATVILKKTLPIIHIFYDTTIRKLSRVKETLDFIS